MPDIKIELETLSKITPATNPASNRCVIIRPFFPKSSEYTRHIAGPSPNLNSTSIRCARRWLDCSLFPSSSISTSLDASSIAHSPSLFFPDGMKYSFSFVSVVCFDNCSTLSNALFIQSRTSLDSIKISSSSEAASSVLILSNSLSRIFRNDLQTSRHQVLFFFDSSTEK